MKNKFVYFTLLVSGIFQLLSISFDQYVIQKESQIRSIDNRSSILSDKRIQIVNGSISFGHFYVQKNIQVRSILDAKRIEEHNYTKVLTNISNNLNDQVKLLLKNEYIPNYKDPKRFLQKPKIDPLLDDIDKNYTEIRSLFNDYGNILPNLYDSATEAFTELEALSETRRKIVSKKFIFLVLGMLSNISSIFFLLLFFYISIKRERDGKKVSD